MLRRLSLSTLVLLVAGAWAADEPPAVPSVAKAEQAEPEQAKPAAGGDKTLSGISILGNQEAPKALTLVPWKSSQLGDTLGISRSLDDSRQPVDRDVFMRELAYYEIRSGSP